METEFWRRKSGFILCQTKREHSRLVPQELCPPLRGIRRGLFFFPSLGCIAKCAFLFDILFIWLLWVLVAAGRLLSCGMGTLSCGTHVGSNSLTRDRTRAPCIGSMES